MMRWAGHIVHMIETRNAYKILFGNPMRRMIMTYRHECDNDTEIDPPIPRNNIC
jgi:hypothetical protein